ncbi:Rubrerythrin 2 [Spironucleus salmonicida]|uniref:Rubrerythrin 2 n=1 Tax=Spironucleus salmonicida TaxID=348837 RepID=K7RUL0_9EUKA|nr:rubrerythrin 2 [Spironucleus salmonicida]KAH0570762.1 Rubrerythrin 2 [Spironucleus salmonicida]KAH0570763.1 Rubrerythrin 2 [Spironucleus salmonicida]|eukprot:EST47563.1 Rubrerythrin 2 [Spironucleus salmonicida]
MSKSIKGTETEKNVLKAFAGESQAFNRYKQFANKAKQEGYPYIEKIFDDNANMEKSHAFRLFSFLEGGDVEITATYPGGKNGTTIENLELSISAETQEADHAYPHFGQVAADEGFPAIAALFRNLAKIEADHAQRFTNLLNLVKSDRVYTQKDATTWICMVCGHVHVGAKAPMKCPVCMADAPFEPRGLDWYVKM